MYLSFVIAPLCQMFRFKPFKGRFRQEDNATVDHLTEATSQLRACQTLLEKLMKSSIQIATDEPGSWVEVDRQSDVEWY